LRTDQHDRATMKFTISFFHVFLTPLMIRV
jgi:hypothetical protein